MKIWGFSQAATHALETAAVAGTMAVVLAGLPGGAAAATGTAASTPKVCSEAGITSSVVQQVFGQSARIGGEGDSETGRCALQAGVKGQPPSDCSDGLPTCINTDVTLHPGSAFSGYVTEEVSSLNSYGHAHKSKFSGAGTGAVLLTSPTGYGEVVNPLVIFKAGSKTVEVAGPFAGESESAAVYKQWEALARKIYAHLSK